MGIYTNGTIYGILIYNFVDDIANTLYERKYDNIMTNQQIKEAFLNYQKLNDKENLFFKIYTECCSTYGDGVYFSWYSIPINIFLEKFDI